MTTKRSGTICHERGCCNGKARALREHTQLWRLQIHITHTGIRVKEIKGWEPKKKKKNAALCSLARDTRAKTCRYEVYCRKSLRWGVRKRELARLSAKRRTDTLYGQTQNVTPKYLYVQNMFVQVITSHNFICIKLLDKSIVDLRQ